MDIIINKNIQGEFYHTLYKNGLLYSECLYINGKKNGVERKWDERKNLIYECRFIDGLEDGLAREWDHNGLIKSEMWLKNGIKQ